MTADPFINSVDGLAQSTSRQSYSFIAIAKAALCRGQIAATARVLHTFDDASLEKIGLDRSDITQVSQEVIASQRKL
ncbi:hypothetical protein [Fodinicurvata sediminis]|uniref:hypothetical protein n=1 Tax=Fodinicurvata sediminis TaxID=1121832 RepID=UPI0003B663F0|nr:hypothetical protein [Fodinicurvata sediminis]